MPELCFHDSINFLNRGEKGSVIERQFKKAAKTEYFDAYGVLPFDDKQEEGFDLLVRQAGSSLKWNCCDKEIGRQVRRSAAAMATVEELFEGVYLQAMEACKEVGVVGRDYRLDGKFVQINASKGQLLQLAKHDLFERVVVFGPKGDDGRKRRGKVPNLDPSQRNLELV